MKINNWKLLLIALILAGCGGQQRMASRYYLIEEPDNSAELIVTAPGPVQDYCEISQVNVYPAYASPKIAIRSDNHEIIYYSFHHWAVRPGDSFTRMLEDYMTRTNIFKRVSTRFWRVEPAYKIETTIEKIEIVQHTDGYSARLALELSLMDNNTNNLILNHEADRTKQLDKKDLNLFSDAIVTMFYEEAGNFCEKILKELPAGD